MRIWFRPMPVRVGLLMVALFLACGEPVQSQAAEKEHGYAPVNGLKMYYEIHGAGGTPLVLLHGGGSTIETTFGKILPILAKSRQVIAFEQQGHGRTADVADRPFTFEQSADDAAALLEHLKIEQGRPVRLQQRRPHRHAGRHPASEAGAQAGRGLRRVQARRALRRSSGSS